MKKNLLKRGRKTIFLAEFSNETIVSEQPVLLGEGSLQMQFLEPVGTSVGSFAFSQLLVTARVVPNI